jgi:outer membrane biosynthesis protein TonB
MENEIKENKYFILWLYISILLHLLVVIIMLSIKPATSPSKDPDPASNDIDAAHVIFMQDKPDPIVPQPQDYKIAARTQGGQIGMQQNQSEQKEAQLDIPAPALSDAYKKDLYNQTNQKDQDDNGQVNIAEHAVIDEHAQPEKAQETKVDPVKNNVQDQEKITTPADTLKAIIQEKMNKSEQSSLTKNYNQPSDHDIEQLQMQKVVSKKHRPAEIGSENLSKVQLTKQTQDTGSQKNKMSLMDIQKGFSQFIQNNHVATPAPSTASTLGNSLYFSSTGNSDKDDISGLKFASYMNQAGKMYQSSFSEYSDFITQILMKEGIPSENNQIAIVIDRSGKVISCTTTLSCGHPVIDNYHLKMIQSIGSFPPIPKYIEAPLQVHAQIPFRNIKAGSMRRSYR